MRKFLLLLALVGLMAPAAKAAEFKHMPVFAFDYTNNMDDNPFVLRTGLLWTTTWKQDNLAGRIQLVHTNQWSKMWRADWHRTSGEGNFSHHHGHNYGSLKLSEASIRWNIMDNMYFAIGRAAKTFGSGKHVSADADSDFLPRSFDGLSLNYDTGFGWLKAFYSSRTSGEFIQRPIEDQTTVVPAHDQHMQMARMGQMEAYGVNFDFKGSNMVPDVNVHAMQVWDARNDATQDKRTKRIRAAANVMGEMAMSDMMKIGYDGTFVYVTGDAKPFNSDGDSLVDKTTAYMWDAMVSLEMKSMFKVWGGMHQDTGNKASTNTIDEDYEPFFYDRYNNAGFMNVVDWGNLTYYYFGASAMIPVINTNIAAYYYMFKDTVEMSQLAQPTNPAMPRVSKEGAELDIVLSRKCSENVSTSIRYSMYKPKNGATAADGTTADPEKQQQIYWYTSITF